MSTFYVREQGAVIQKVDERLLVTKDRKRVDEIPLHRLDQLVVMGNIQLTTQAMAMLLNAGADVVFTSQFGKVRGRLLADDNKYAELRVRQLQAMSSPVVALTLAKQIVLGKLSNQEAVLLTRGGLALERPALGLVPDLGGAARSIRDMLAQGMLTGNADSLRGFEGKAATFYWPAFRRLLKRDMGFQGRVYRPSTDPINALLSFGYALLQKDVNAMVRLVGLDAYLGFFHTVQYGRPSLVLDLMEEFRPVVVDAFVLTLINRDLITTSDFQRNDEDEGLRLKEQPLRRVIEAYEERLETRIMVRNGPRMESMSYRRCIETQTRQLARVIKGETPEFLPLAASV